MNKLLKKIIATLLTITLGSANLLVIGSYGTTYALSDSELSEQTSETNNTNIEFNAYFENNIHIETAKISEATKLFINVKVKNAGYLENAQIMLQNANYKISQDINNKNIQSVDKENNKILLNQLNSGSNITLEIPITILNDDKVSLDNFSKESKVVLTGNYIDGNAKENEIYKEIVNKLYWEGTAEGIVEGELTKYIPYNIEEQYGVILQAQVNTGILNSTLPIKETQVNIKVPEINNQKPTSVNVIANNTKASNGNIDGTEFDAQNYTYNNETGIVTITVTNLQNAISWVKDVKDEFLVNFTFEGKDIYDFVNENKLNALSEVEAKIQVYNNEPTTITKNTTIEMIEEEKLGNITDFEILASEYISKGQMYANYEAEDKKETNYTVRYEAVINNIKLVDSITLIQSRDELENATNSSTLNLKDSVYNKTIIISQKIFNKILGQDGIIEIYNKNNEKIAIIDKDAKKDEEGNYITDISSKDEAEISIITSKPISEGKLSIEVEKAIKGNFPYTKQQLKTSTKLNTKLEGKINNSSVEKLANIELKEPKNIVELSLNKAELSNIVENKNVEIRVTLDTSSIDYALYKNPTLEIRLPSCISKLKLSSYDILMDNGLKIKNVKAENQDGAAVIFVQLEGIQTEYTIGAEYKGTIIIINTDITVKPLTPSTREKIIMKYTNENDILSQAQNAKTNSVESDNIIETEVNFVAPTGVLLSNGISNYKEDSKEVLSTTEDTITAIINPYTEEITANIYGKVVNNYENNIENIQILGRFPIEGNKEIDSNTDLGSNFSMKVDSNIALSGIEESKYTIYYSENAQASKDIANTSNGWTTTRTENAKSYLIVTNDYTMEKGKSIEFSYNAKIPSDLKYNKSSYEIYKVYYQNNSEIGNIEETKNSPKVEITTGEGPELTATITPTAEVIREGQVVKMKLEVKNTGTIKAENVKVNIPLPEYTDFVVLSPGSTYIVDEGKLKSFELGNLEPNQTITVSYHIRFKRQIEEIDTSENKEIIVKNTATMTADNIQGEVKVEDCNLTIKEGIIAVNLVSDIDETQILQSGNTIRYEVELYNISDQDKIENINVTINLPKGFIGKQVVIENETRPKEELEDAIKYNIETNVITVNIDKIETTRNIKLTVLVNDCEGNVSANAFVSGENIEEHYSNISEYEVEKVNLEISELTSTPTYIKEGEKVEYHLKITNKGKSDVYSIRVTDILPEGLIFEKATYTIDDDNTERLINFIEDDKLEIPITETLGSNQTINIIITAIADLLPDKNEKEIQNYVSIKANSFQETKTNTVINYIQYNSEIDRPNDDEEQQTVNRITGAAWIDANKNGKRDEDEQILPNMDIVLINKKDNTIVKDIYTGEEKRVKTDSNGQYEINNLPKGEYIVIFVYNSSMYSLTTYKSEGVSEQLNSDAVDIYVTLDGVKRLAGMSDVIKISGNDVRNINIGLYEAEKFDLKLEKYITKTTLTTPTIGTKVTTYEDKKVTKVEVLKGNLGKSNVIIEYKIVVTNQGTVPGYVKKIVDYLPEDVSFYSEINKDWYLSENGNAYNTSLANTVINPGESKEVTIILSKIITEKSLGTLNNTAEIYESYNELGLKDVNSEPGNKAENENDMSKADIVLSIVTGKVIIYGLLGLTITSMLAFGVVMIKKKVLNKK